MGSRGLDLVGRQRWHLLDEVAVDHGALCGSRVLVQAQSYAKGQSYSEHWFEIAE